MAVTPEQLRSYIGASTGDLDWVTESLDTALELLAKHLGGTVETITPEPPADPEAPTPEPYKQINLGTLEVPQTVIDLATKDVGSRLFARRGAPNGVASFVTDTGATIQTSRDPLIGVYPMLRDYLPAGFA